MMWTTVNSTSQKTEIRISKVEEGSAYVFRVMSENAQGLSEPAETPAVTAKDRYCVPSPPNSPIIKDIHKDMIGLSWNAPLNGGKAIFNYVVEKKNISEDRWVRVTKVLYFLFCWT